MAALDAGEAGAFWRRLGPALDETFGRPRAILALSAHSLTRLPVLLAGPRHETIHDFSGFPDALYKMRYDAPGAPDVAPRAAELLKQAGIEVQSMADGQGLDHGIWAPLRSIYPEVDVPILPLAWPPMWTPEQLWQFGAALAPLADEGVLIMGTGALTHNLRLFASGRGPVQQPEYPECAAFRGWFKEHAAAGDHAALVDYRKQAPYAAQMHPTDEHLLPFFIAAGAGEHGPGVRLHGSVEYGHLSMDCYAFGRTAPVLAEALESATV